MSAPRYASGLIRDRAFVWAVENGDHVHSRRPDGAERCHRVEDERWCFAFEPRFVPDPGPDWDGVQFTADMMRQVVAKMREDGARRRRMLSSPPPLSETPPRVVP